MLQSTDFLKLKAKNQKISMLTAYDFSMAKALEKAGIDCLLVGDSLAMVFLGHPNTRSVSVDQMIHHAAAVRVGAPSTFLIGDLPYQGVKKGPKQTLISSKRFIREAGCNAVKLEYSKTAFESAKLLSSHKIPFVGHVGLTPQMAKTFKDFHLHAANAKEAFEVYKQALEFERLGALMVVLECIPSEVSRQISANLKIPTIGIGAGPDCDGQVLVTYDLVGLFSDFKPRFVKRYTQLGQAIEQSAQAFVRDLKTDSFPLSKHAYKMDKKEQSLFMGLLSSRNR